MCTRDAVIIIPNDCSETSPKMDTIGFTGTTVGPRIWKHLHTSGSSILLVGVGMSNQAVQHNKAAYIQTSGLLYNDEKGQYNERHA